jgi:hypothetical protein
MNKISVELPLSTRAFLMTHPDVFTSITMASLWFVDFNLKSCSVKVIGTLAHSSRATGPSLMTVFTDLKLLFLCLFVSNSMIEPPVIGMIVPKEGNAFGLWLLELDSGLDELFGGGGNIS